jgi:chromosome segregation ATPase
MPGLSQILAILGFLGGAGAGVWVIARVIAEKKLRTPTDKRSDIELGVKLLTDAQEQDRKDKELNDRQIETLRGWVVELTKAAQSDHVEKQELYDRINELQERIGDLITRNQEKTARIRELEDRISKISQKLIRGEIVTLADLAGVEDTGEGLMDDEDEYTIHRLSPPTREPQK